MGNNQIQKRILSRQGDYKQALGPERPGHMAGGSKGGKQVPLRRGNCPCTLKIKYISSWLYLWPLVYDMEVIK